MSKPKNTIRHATDLEWQSYMNAIITLLESPLANLEAKPTTVHAAKLAYHPALTELSLRQLNRLFGALESNFVDRPVKLLTERILSAVMEIVMEHPHPSENRRMGIRETMDFALSFIPAWVAGKGNITTDTRELLRFDGRRDEDEIDRIATEIEAELDEEHAKGKN